MLKKYAADPLVLKSVRDANARKTTLDQTKKLDAEWIAGTGGGFAKEILDSGISRFLSKKVKSNKLLYTEAFLCDRMGATVGAFPSTSDYWQGDEKKFTESFKDGKVFIGPLELDESTKSYSVQVSVPVRDADKTIGVLVMGLRNVE